MPPPTPVAPGVWRITTPLPFRPRSVHAYLARGSDAEGWMLVDGGIDAEAAWSALDAGVRVVAGGWGAIRLHLVTHMHQDHLGLWARVRDACGAPLAMGRMDAERAAHAAREPDEEARYRRRLLRENGAPAELHPPGGGRPPPVPAVAHPLPERDTPLPGFGSWVSVWTPGHTAGHVSLLRPEDGVLLAGDAILPRITPTLGVNRQREDPVGDYLDALSRLRMLRPRLGLAGHGEPIADPAARIDELRAEAEAEGERVAALLGEEPASAWEVARARYPGRDLPASAWMQALRETRAHLDRLERQGRVRREWRDGAACFVRADPAAGG